MVGGCVRPSGLWDLVLSALRIVESGCVRPSGLWDLVLSALRDCGSGFVCPSGAGVDDGGWLCPPFGRRCGILVLLNALRV